MLKAVLFYRAAIDISSSASKGTLDTVRNIKVVLMSVTDYI